MDPITILAIIGAIYALKSGGKAVARASHAAGAAAVVKPAAGSTGGGMPGWLTRQRHTGSGWWAGELRHGFPVFRAGVREGWTHHQTAMAQRQAEVAKARADGTGRQQTYRQERDAHRQRLEEIERQERERKAAEAARAAAAAPAPAPAAGSPGHPVMAPPLPNGRAGGQTPARPAPTPAHDPAAWRDDPAATCSDPECAYCGGPGNGNGNGKKPAGSKPAGTSTGGTMTDTTYEGTEQALEDIRGKLDYATNDDEISAAENMADALPGALPDDSETVGHVAELAAALREVKDAQQRAIDACEAAKASHEKNNQASKEAADAQGGAPERGYVVSG